MRINPLTSQNLEQIQNDKPQAATGAKAGANSKQCAQPGCEDKVSLSDEAKLRNLAMQSAQSGDGIRHDKVAELKAKLAAHTKDGKLDVDGLLKSGDIAGPTKVAEGIVREELDLFI